MASEKTKIASPNVLITNTFVGAIIVAVPPYFSTHLCAIAGAPGEFYSGVKAVSSLCLARVSGVINLYIIAQK